MSELNFDDKNKKEVEAIAAKEAEEARIEEEKVVKEADEAKPAEEAAPVEEVAPAEEAEEANEDTDRQARIEEAWKQQAYRCGYPTRKRPENWGWHIK